MGIISMYYILSKKQDNPLILPLDLMYGNLIYLSNQAKICALQQHEFGCILRSKI